MIYRTIIHSSILLLICVELFSTGDTNLNNASPIQNIGSNTECEEVNKSGWNIDNLKNQTLDAWPFKCLSLRFNNDSLDDLIFRSCPDLYDAASKGYIGFFQFHANKLRAYELMSPRDEDNLTSAELAAENGHLNIIKYIIEKGDFLLDENQLLTVVESAVHHGQFALVNYLFDEKKLTSTFREKFDDRILREAARGGNVDMLKYLIESKKFSPLINDTHLLYASIKSKNIDIVKYLVEDKGFLPNTTSRQLLYQAAASGNIAIFTYFEGKNFSVNATDRFLLCAAAIGGNVELMKYLIYEKNLTKYCTLPLQQNNALHLAALADGLNAVRFLIETLNYKVNRKNAHGESPSHSAAVRGSLPVLKYLIEQKGADLNATTNYRDYLLHCAARSLEGLPAVEYLVEEKHMNLELTNLDGSTPLQEAVTHGKLGVVKYLAGEKKANINTTDIYGHNLLHLAVLRSNFNTMKYLLNDMNMSARINEVDSYNCTITMIAARCSRVHQNTTHSSHAIFKYLTEEKHAIHYTDEYCEENCRDINQYYV